MGLTLESQLVSQVTSHIDLPGKTSLEEMASLASFRPIENSPNEPTLGFPCKSSLTVSLVQLNWLLWLKLGYLTGTTSLPVTLFSRHSTLKRV